MNDRGLPTLFCSRFSNSNIKNTNLNAKYSIFIKKMLNSDQLGELNNKCSH